MKINSYVKLCCPKCRKIFILNIVKMKTTQGNFQRFCPMCGVYNAKEVIEYFLLREGDYTPEELVLTKKFCEGMKNEKKLSAILSDVRNL